MEMIKTEKGLEVWDWARFYFMGFRSSLHFKKIGLLRFSNFEKKYVFEPLNNIGYVDSKFIEKLHMKILNLEVKHEDKLLKLRRGN